MIKQCDAQEIFDKLTEINQLFDRWYAGEGDDVVQEIDMEIGVLRDILWHEVPRSIARAMDEQEKIRHEAVADGGSDSVAASCDNS